MTAELKTQVVAMTRVEEQPPKKRLVGLTYSVELTAECGCKEARATDGPSGCRCGEHREAAPFTDGQREVLNDISRQLSEAFSRVEGF